MPSRETNPSAVYAVVCVLIPIAAVIPALTARYGLALLIGQGPEVDDVWRWFEVGSFTFSLLVKIVFGALAIWCGVRGLEVARQRSGRGRVLSILGIAFGFITVLVGIGPVLQGGWWAIQ
ncbi:hypothetical protein [Schumannella luteola]|jgi:hypothetical protein